MYFKFNLSLKKNPQKPVRMALRPTVHRMLMCLPWEAHLRPNWWSWTSWEHQTFLCWVHLCVSLGLGALLWTCCKTTKDLDPAMEATQKENLQVRSQCEGLHQMNLEMEKG